MVNVDKAFELRYKINGVEFQLLVDFDKLKEFKKNSDQMTVFDVLADSKIYKDQRKGEVASANLISDTFPKKSQEEVLKEMLLKGECQIPTAYLNSLREEKKVQIINYIAANSVNPGNKMKFTVTMIESEVNKLSYNVSADLDSVKQAEEVIKLLKKKIAISIEKSIIEMAIPGQYCGAFYGPFRQNGKITKEYYDDQGLLRLHIEVTAGVVDDVINYIKLKTNNEAEYHISKP